MMREKQQAGREDQVFQRRHTYMYSRPQYFDSHRGKTNQTRRLSDPSAVPRVVQGTHTIIQQCPTKFLATVNPIPTGVLLELFPPPDPQRRKPVNPAATNSRPNEAKHAPCETCA